MNRIGKGSQWGDAILIFKKWFFTSVVTIGLNSWTHIVMPTFCHYYVYMASLLFKKLIFIWTCIMFGRKSMLWTLHVFPRSNHHLCPLFPLPLSSPWFTFSLAYWNSPLIDFSPFSSAFQSNVHTAAKLSFLKHCFSHFISCVCEQPLTCPHFLLHWG